MGKKAKAPVPTVNRRALSRHEREARARLALYIGAGVVVALIVGVLLVGLYQTRIAEPASPVATVNGQSIRTDAYQNMVRYRRYELRNSLAWVEGYLAQLDPDDEAQQSLYNYMAQQQRQLQSQAMSLGPTVLEQLIEDELVRQEAARRGLSVSPDEVQREIEQQFGYNLPTPEPATAAEPTPGADAEPTATPAPTATPMSQEEFQRRYDETVQSLRQNARISEAAYREQAGLILLRRKLQEAMAAEVPTAGEQVRARHILVEEEEAARAALERIRQGEDFAAVAQEVTIDTSTREEGGDLGWIARGIMVDEFEAAAFALQPGQVSELVQTDYGFHIIKVEERDPNRPFDEATLANHRARALGEWLTTQRNSDAVQRFWSSAKMPPDPSARP